MNLLDLRCPWDVCTQIRLLDRRMFGGKANKKGAEVGGKVEEGGVPVMGRKVTSRDLH